MAVAGFAAESLLRIGFGLGTKISSPLRGGLCLLKKKSQYVERSRYCYSATVKSPESFTTSPVAITQWKISRDHRCLEVDWHDGTKSQFPFVYLRDCCKCSKCFEGASKQRMIDTCNDVALDIRASKVAVDGCAVQLQWPDGHVTKMGLDWLWDRRGPTRFLPGHDCAMKDISKIPRVLWGNGFELPKFDFQAVANDDHARWAWFQQFAAVGVTVLTDAGKKVGALAVLRDNVFGGYYKHTHYGDTFDVISKPNPNSLAYTTKRILPHVDLPHYEYSPGIQVLHCIEQYSGEGGDNVLTDGYQVSKLLRERDPDAFRTLTELKVRFRDVGADKYGQFETFYERPIIGLDYEDQVRSVDYSNWLRDDFFDASAADIIKFYDAYYKLTKEINAPSNVVKYKLKEGEVIVMDNRRVLHGRIGFESSQSFSRFLNGCYFDWDALYWRTRVLKRRIEAKQRNV